MPERPGRIKGRRWLLVLLGVAAFIAIVYWAGVDRLDALWEAELDLAAFALLALAAVTATSTMRWALIGNRIAGGYHFTFSQYYTSLLTSRVLGLFVSRAGSDIGVRVASHGKVGKAGLAPAAAAVGLDQLFDLSLLVAWLAPTVLLLSGGVPEPVGWGLLVLATGLAFWAMVHLGSVVRWVARAMSQAMSWLGRTRKPGRLSRLLLARVNSIEKLATTDNLPRGMTLLLGVLTVTRYLLNATMFYLIAAALHLGVPFVTFLLGGAVVQLSLLAAATPGGLGVMDAGWIFVLALAGVPTTVAAAFVVGQRAFQYLAFPILAGVGYLAIVRRDRPSGAKPTADD